MSQKNETTVLVISLVVTLTLMATGWWLFKYITGKPDGTGNPSSAGVTKLTESGKSNQPVQERISGGEKLLISSGATPEKQAGVQAIASGNYREAISKLEASLKRDRNDPEALIYLNNAHIGNQKSYTIATSVPIGSDLNAAKEILRGVAQAQKDRICQQDCLIMVAAQPGHQFGET